MIEALVAFLVLAAAGLAAARLQSPLRAGADSARLQATAMFLARLDIEQARGYATIAAPASAAAGTLTYDGIASRGAASASAIGAMTEFQVSRVVVTNADPFVHDKTISNRVTWTDRAGGAQEFALDTVIAGADPALTGALWLTRAAPPLLPLDGHAPGVPRDARRLGDGTSLVALSGADLPVLRVDDSTGAVLAVCPSEFTSRAGITPPDLATCTPARGLLLTGRVRFDSGAAPDALAAGERALPLDLRVRLTDGGDPALPPTCGTALDPTGDGVSYRCAVYTGASRRPWSGSSVLVPIGWTIGPTSTQHQVCRDSTDQDGSGAIDRNAEHPAAYTAVTENLTQQNFLVVRGDVACPNGTAP